MICKGCNQAKTNYHFYAFRGNYNIAKATFFTRPVYEIDGSCFECAGPYRCLRCGVIQDASQFRTQGRWCIACKHGQRVKVDREKTILERV